MVGISSLILTPMKSGMGLGAAVQSRLKCTAPSDLYIMFPLDILTINCKAYIPLRRKTIRIGYFCVT